MPIPTTDFATARPDADYAASMAAMRAAIDRFKGCNEQELRELSGDLDQLSRMAEKLRAGRVDIAVFGEGEDGELLFHCVAGTPGEMQSCGQRETIP